MVTTLEHQYLISPTKSNVKVSHNISYTKDKIEEDEGPILKVVGREDDDIMRTRAPIKIAAQHTNNDDNDDDGCLNDRDSRYRQDQDEQDSSSSTTSPIRILHSLPNYQVGDIMRDEDMILCASKHTTQFAMDKLRRGDCVFILR